MTLAMAEVPINQNHVEVTENLIRIQLKIMFLLFPSYIGHSDEVIWQRDGDQGNGWHRANISLVSDGPYRLVLQGSRGSTSTETGIALDDIRFSETSCCTYLTA